MFQRIATGKYCVIFVGPELAVNEVFHKKVLRSNYIKENAIMEIIDEGHCISEWGEEDFRPDYSKLGILQARLPLPMCVASATTPQLVKVDITTKLGILADHKTLAISNQKLNAVLSVQILQHSHSTFADLMTIFNSTISKLEDFPQTIIYVNSHLEAEQLEEFLRDNAPRYMSRKNIEFYHRFIDEGQKRLVESKIGSGELKIIIATDALRMVRHCSNYYISEVLIQTRGT
jgi:superfamily II DNA helicase RecQ